MNKLKIPYFIKFKIYFSLLTTIVLFISIYIVLYYIGNFVGSWWFEITEPKLLKNIGFGFVAVGLIPLIFAIFVKSRDYGYKINEKDFPKLFKFVNEIADNLGTKRPDEIQLLPTDEIYITGLFKRKIGIGIVGLRGITKEEFKAILFHEFAHLHGKDTIVGALLSKIQISLESSSKFGKSWWDYVPMAQLAVIGLAITAFAKIYSFIFRFAISFYSRQVEYRADYIASIMTNKEIFGKALVNYSAYIIYFNEYGYDSIYDLLSQNKQFINIYDFINKNYNRIDNEKVRKIILEKDEGGLFLSHPSLHRRLHAIGLKNINIKHPNKEIAVTLLDKSNKIEQDMTSILTNNMHVNLLYVDAVQREGKCRYCGEQFDRLDNLLNHERAHEQKNL